MNTIIRTVRTAHGGPAIHYDLAWTNPGLNRVVTLSRGRHAPRIVWLWLALLIGLGAWMGPPLWHGMGAMIDTLRQPVDTAAGAVRIGPQGQAADLLRAHQAQLADAIGMLDGAPAKSPAGVKTVAAGHQ